MNTRCFTAPLGLSKVIEFNIELKLVNFQATENGIWQMSHAQVTGGVDIDMQARKKKTELLLQLNSLLICSSETMLQIL